MNGKHYVRGLTVILIIDDLILELQFREFWKQNDNGKYSVIAEIRQLQVLLAKKKRCPKEFRTLLDNENLKPL